MMPLSSLPDISESERIRLRIFAEQQKNAEYLLEQPIFSTNGLLDGLKADDNKTMAHGAGKL